MGTLLGRLPTLGIVFGFFAGDPSSSELMLSEGNGRGSHFIPKFWVIIMGGNTRPGCVQASIVVHLEIPTLTFIKSFIMAKSTPSSNPMESAASDVDTLLAQAGKLLTLGGKIMGSMANETEQTLAVLYSADLSTMVKVDRHGSRASKILHSLEDDSEPTGMPTRLRGFLEGLLSNSYVDKMYSYKNTSVSERQRKLHAQHRELMLMNLSSLLTRIKSMMALPLISIRRGIENKYLGCPTHLWNISRAYREVVGEKWVDDALACPSVKAWKAPPREPLSEEIDLCCRDNLEWYRSVKFARHKEGKKLENELLHTVTGEHFHIPASLVDHLPDPLLGNDWPFMGT